MDKDLVENLHQNIEDSVAIEKLDMLPSKKSEPEYLPTMIDAAEEFCISVKYLRWLAQEQFLPVYIYTPVEYEAGSRHCYARVINPKWSCDTLDFCTVERPDGVVQYITGYSYNLLMVRRSELHEALNQIKDQPDNTIATQGDNKRKCNLPSRKDGDTIPARPKAPITMILECVFDECAINNPEILNPGNREALFNFIKKKVTSEAILPDGQSFSYYIDKVVSKGSNMGIFMQHSIEGREAGSIKDKWYSAAYITQRISRIRQIRNNQK